MSILSRLTSSANLCTTRSELGLRSATGLGMGGNVISLGGSSSFPLLQRPSVRWISVKRRRAVKMNKHKYEKLKKRMRRLTAKNLKGNAL